MSLEQKWTCVAFDANKGAGRAWPPLDHWTSLEVLSLFGGCKSSWGLRGLFLPQLRAVDLPQRSQQEHSGWASSLFCPAWCRDIFSLALPCDSS